MNINRTIIGIGLLIGCAYLLFQYGNPQWGKWIYMYQAYLLDTNLEPEIISPKTIQRNWDAQGNLLQKFAVTETGSTEGSLYAGLGQSNYRSKVMEITFKIRDLDEPIPTLTDLKATMANGETTSLLYFQFYEWIVWDSKTFEHEYERIVSAFNNYRDDGLMINGFRLANDPRITKETRLKKFEQARDTAIEWVHYLAHEPEEMQFSGDPAEYRQSTQRKNNPYRAKVRQAVEEASLTFFQNNLIKQLKKRLQADLASVHKKAVQQGLLP